MGPINFSDFSLVAGMDGFALSGVGAMSAVLGVGSGQVVSLIIVSESMGSPGVHSDFERFCRSLLEYVIIYDLKTLVLAPPSVYRVLLRTKARRIQCPLHVIIRRNSQLWSKRLTNCDFCSCRGTLEEVSTISDLVNDAVKTRYSTATSST